MLRMEGPGSQGPQEAELVARALQPPAFNSGITAEFRVESLTCPNSRTRLAPLTDFNWPRPLPPTADHPRQEDHVGKERQSVSNPDCQNRESSSLPNELSGSPFVLFKVSSIFRSSLSYFIAYFKLSGFNLIARTVLTMYTYGLLLLFVLFEHAISPHITAQCAVAYRHAYLLHTSILVS